MPVRRRLATVAAVVLAVILIPPPLVAAAEAPANGQGVVLAGMYSDQWRSRSDLDGLALASGKRVSLVGTFHTLRESEDGWEWTTAWQLEQAWRAQATPVANVNVHLSAYEVAAGAVDHDIRAFAGRVREWVGRGGGRSLLVAPMQEMNGDWVPYGLDPGNYRIAFRRFVQIFREEGLDETSIRWVFAPNSWSVHPYRIADYYPGDDVVDLLGISAYNFGSLVDRWTSLYEAVAPGLAEMEAIAPGKPYLVTQVGSSTAGGDRDAWIRDLFALAASHPNIVGFVYFNFIKETDWKVWDGTALASGWWEGMRMESTVHRWPLNEWFQPGPLRFAPHQGRFADDDGTWSQPDIEWLAGRGIAQGCAPDRFCPGEVVTRGQLATFVARALGLAPVAEDHFADDDLSPHEADINALAAAGITAGCEEGAFCPLRPVSRQQLASLLVRAFGLPPAPPPADLADPPADAHLHDVGALLAAGISQGCGEDLFCPTAVVSRQHLAAFLRRALEVHLAVEVTPDRWRRHRPE